MLTRVPHFYLIRAVAAWIMLGGIARAGDPVPPDGFRALFNGQNLTGWYGWNPHDGANLKGDEREQNLQRQREEFPQNWIVDNGELVNDGHGPYATTDEEFGDIELLLEYKTVAGADSGIYLRGTPQVQIWDWNQVFNPEQPTRRPHLGSGGLFNNTPGRAGRDPLALADRPFGEWNQFRIRQIGDRTWVWLNDVLVVDGAVMENYWNRSQPLPERGPIMLQTHGGEIRWRNIYVREIPPDEARQLVRDAAEEVQQRLAGALTLHASFDNGLDADFSKGDATAYVQSGGELAAAGTNDDVRIEPDAGRFGGALRFVRKNDLRPAYRNEAVINYKDESWSTSVGVWLRLNPDEDLEPGYCDPVQIVGNDYKKGFIFLEFSKDETPRLFRYAVRPLFEIWNPNELAWDAIPPDERPMVQVERPPFSREEWTHVLFTVENANADDALQRARLYLNGQPQGTIEHWDLTLDWDPASVLLVLGAAYVGQLDDLAVFDRALTDREVEVLYGLEDGAAGLR